MIIILPDMFVTLELFLSVEDEILKINASGWIA